MTGSTSAAMSLQPCIVKSLHLKDAIEINSRLFHASSYTLQWRGNEKMITD